MAAISLADAEAQLAIVQAAISELLQGKRRSRLEVRSGTFLRVFQYQEITLDNLYQLRDELLAIISSYYPEQEQKFRANCTVPVTVTKNIY